MNISKSKKIFSFIFLSISLLIGAQSTILLSKQTTTTKEKAAKIVVDIAFHTLKKILFAQTNVNNFLEFQSKIEKTIKSHLSSKCDANSQIGIEKTSKRSFLTWAIMANNVALAKKLLTLGANPNLQSDARKDTPLMYLAFSSYLFTFDPTNMLELLLKNGADPKMTNKEGKDTLFVANKIFNQMMLDALKQQGYE